MTRLQDSCLEVIREALSPAHALMLDALLSDLAEGAAPVMTIRKAARKRPVYRIESLTCQTILKRLGESPANIKDLAAVVTASPNNIYGALRMLIDNGLVEKISEADRRAGISALYALKNAPSVRASA